jgi:transposase
MILLAADGQTNAGIAVTVGTRPATVSQWRLRFECKGLVGLRGDFRPGRPTLENKEGFRERLLAKNR